jgi:hypothetical protein
VFAPTTTVAVEVPYPGAGIIVAGLKLIESPAGRPDADNAIAELNPLK